jgi:hypothetical protein
MNINFYVTCTMWKQSLPESFFFGALSPLALLPFPRLAHYIIAHVISSFLIDLDLRDDEDDVPTELLEPKPSTDSTTGFDLSEAKAKLADKAQQLQIQIQHQQEVVTKPTTTSPIEPRKDRKSRFGDKDASSARSGSEAVTETTNRMDTDEDGGGTGSQVSAPQLHEEGHFEDREEPGPARSPSPSQDEHWHSPPQEPRHSPPALSALSFSPWLEPQE